MTDYGSYPAGLGFAWRGDWLARLLDILREKGFESLTSFAHTMPLATLDDLVASLGEGDVAPIQLQWRLVDEAQASKTSRECALDLFVRFLREAKQGWPSDLSWEGQEDVRSVLTSWQTSLKNEQHEAFANQIVDELLEATDIPPGWLPSSTDDPRLVDLFDRHWPQG
jgi:hypothetical protein